jgi:hypothetical protein
MTTTYGSSRSTFTADTTAIASEVNSNFTLAFNALNSFDITNCTGTIDLARISDLTSTQMASTFFLDEDNMASDSATAVASQQSIKAHVTASSTDGWNPTSYAAEESVTVPNSIIVKQGSDSIAVVTTKAITFAVAFPTTCIFVLVQQTGNFDQSAYGPLTVYSQATTGFTVRNHNGGLTRNFDWFAFGY